MNSIPPEHSSLAEAAHDIAELLGEDRLARIQVPPRGDDPATERRIRAEALAAVADGRREPLEQLRFRFVRRLHRASDDFAATEGLRVVEAALSLIPRSEGVWGLDRRNEQRPRKRWWRRKSAR